MATEDAEHDVVDDVQTSLPLTLCSVCCICVHMHAHDGATVAASMLYRCTGTGNARLGMDPLRSLGHTDAYMKHTTTHTHTHTCHNGLHCSSVCCAT